VAGSHQIEASERQGLIATKAISLRQAFDIQPQEIISLVGAGGKTTLMFALAKELTSSGESVITTTTTKIFEWQSSEAPLLLEIDEARMIALLLKQLKEHRQVTLARERLLAEGKLKGISPELVVTLAELEQVSYIVVEADGAARKPLKAPNTTEPVIPQNTSLLIPIVGFDALGCKITNEDVFRPEIISRLTGLPLGAIILADAIATLITHPEGIIKGSPTNARIIPLINKMDLAQDLSQARDLACRILEKRHPQIKRVVLGQVRFPEPIVEVVLATEVGT
jgi:probable selenium-dependent hydroxylase accessory protein YqeC